MQTSSVEAVKPLNEQQFLHKLRQATGPAHAALEQLPMSLSIVKPDITTSAYANYLLHMLEVVHDAEQHIYPLLKDSIADLDKRNKADLIRKDLAAIGIPFQESNSNPLSGPLNDISVPFAIGILYVIEGSTLGGRFILKNIQATLGYDQDHGASYFAGYGDQTGILWKTFLNALTDYESVNQNGDAIIEGAVYAFNAIHKYFEASSLVTA